MTLDPERLARFEAKLDRVADDASKCLHILEGNGTPGLKTRVDRLEQTEASRQKWLGIIGGTAASGLFVALWAGIKQLVK